MGGNGGGGGDGVTVVGRAEIDMRAPFRSVKEAVVLFGERVLAGDLRDGAGPRLGTSDLKNRAGEMPASRSLNHEDVGVFTAAARHTPAVELEEAKEELVKERSEKQKMAGCILSLQEELSNAMRELKKLRARDDDDDGEEATKVIDLQVEDLKFVEIEKQNPPANGHTDNATAASASPDEFQKRRYVTFADLPMAAYRTPPQPPLPDVVMELHHRHNAPAPAPQLREVRFLRQMSVGHGMMKSAAAVADHEGRKKKKKKLVIPLVGALFMRKKETSSSCCCHDDSTIIPRTSF